MVKVVYVCEKCEDRYGKPQVTKDKAKPSVPRSKCEGCGYTGTKYKRKIAVR
jgi:MinD superfamily P-loop ATPase